MSTVRGLTAALNGAGRFKYRKPESVVDHLVIGGGVVGLAIAKQLSVAFPEKSTYLVERNTRAGEETSSRNSEVIHAGIYYPSGSLKQRFCLRGKHLIYQNYPHLTSRIGKYIVGRSHQEDYLRKLYDHCVNTPWPQIVNAADPSGKAIDIELISGDELRKLEPDLSPDITLALWSPSTGIMDSHSFIQSLEGDIKGSDNAELVYSTAVVRVDPYKPSPQPHGSPTTDPTEDGWVVQVSTEGSEDALLARTLINAAGLSATLILNSLLPQPIPVYYAPGNYVSYKGPGAAVSHLIYPVPATDKTGHGFQSLGTHLTLDMDKNVRFGPDLRYVSPPSAKESHSSNPDDIDYWKHWLVPDEARIDSMYEDIRTYLPNISRDGLTPDYVGIRPKLIPPGRGFQDFVIREDVSRSFFTSDAEPSGAPMITLMGIESPGLTSSLAIAEHVVGMLS